MEPEAKYTVVGTAALILIALVAAAVVWLSASGGGKRQPTLQDLFRAPITRRAPDPQRRQDEGDPRWGGEGFQVLVGASRRGGSGH